MAEWNLNIKSCAGKPFIPSNGTEGMSFIEKYCANCINERWMHFQDEDKEEDKCKILTSSMISTEPIKEWNYDDTGSPKCSSFVKWDWGTDDDRREPPPKPSPPSNDPNQLLMPFDIWELLGVSDDIIVTKGVIIERELVEY